MESWAGLSFLLCVWACAFLIVSSTRKWHDNYHSESRKLFTCEWCRVNDIDIERLRQALDLFEVQQVTRYVVVNKDTGEVISREYDSESDARRIAKWFSQHIERDT